MSVNVHQQIDDLAKMRPGWDTYGAKSITAEAIKMAHVVADHWTGALQAVPCSNGGVQLEQHSDGVDIEIEISPRCGHSVRI